MRYMTSLDVAHYSIGFSDPTFLNEPDDTTPISYDVYVPLYGGTTSNQLVVARLIWNKREQEFEFHSVGMRWFDAMPTERMNQLVRQFAEEKATGLRRHYAEERERWLGAVTEWARAHEMLPN